MSIALRSKNGDTGGAAGDRQLHRTTSRRTRSDSASQTPTPTTCVEEAIPVKDVSQPRIYTTYIELVVDGEIVDLNRIPLPADTPIIDKAPRFQMSHAKAQRLRRWQSRQMGGASSRAAAIRRPSSGAPWSGRSQSRHKRS